MIELVPGNEPPQFEFTPDAGPVGGYAYPHKPSKTQSIGGGMFTVQHGDQPGMTLHTYLASRASDADVQSAIDDLGSRYVTADDTARKVAFRDCRTDTQRRVIARLYFADTMLKAFA